MAEVKNICMEALERHCVPGESGRLDLRRGPYDGQIFTDNGLIVHAQLSALDGVPALFRLFDWGDAEAIWMPGIQPEKPSLNLKLDEASTLYAENLQERAELQASAKERIDQAFLAPESVANNSLGLESVLKHYTISLESTDPAVLPGGFTFTDTSKSSYVIGSSEDCDVRLINPSVDPLHCGVILERGSVLVWDLGAQSGVKLNGNSIEQDVLKVGDVMTLGEAELRVRFQIRRPTIRPKVIPVDPKAKPVTGPIVAPPVPQSTTGTMPLPKVASPSAKEVPKGPITYDKVVKQLKQRDKGMPFLEKLGSLFGSKKK